MRRVALALCGALACGGAWGIEPKIAPGHDPGGTAVAILADGFDTTRPEIARLLARDGEGEAIAWDAVDGDHTPFAEDGDGTALVRAAAALGGVRIVPVRVAAGDVASIARGIAFAAKTPARIVVLRLAADQSSARDMLSAAARQFRHVLFVAAVGESIAGLPEDVVTVGLGADVTAAASDSALGAAEAVARVLGCGGGDLEGQTGAERKRAFLGRVGPAPLPDPPECEKGTSKGEPGR